MKLALMPFASKTSLRLFNFLTSLIPTDSNSYCSVKLTKKAPIRMVVFYYTINSSDAQISFKIRINKEKGNMPILYNGNKESQIDFFMNNFELNQ